MAVKVYVVEITVDAERNEDEVWSEIGEALAACDDVLYSEGFVKEED